MTLTLILNSGIAELSMIILCLLRAGVKHICMLHRGYEGCHELFAAGIDLFHGKCRCDYLQENWN